jgi:hypothetical protein
MTKLETARSLAWQHGVVSVEGLGGMLGPTLFLLPDGSQIAPFHVAPWANETAGEALPPILRRLRGEWPCVPFGFEADRYSNAGWPTSLAAAAIDSLPHGYCSNADWRFEAEQNDSIGLAIDYPEDHPIRRLVRRVTPDPDAAAIDFELTIDVRGDCHLPIGLHPVFRLPLEPGAMDVEVEDTVTAMTYPGAVDASSIFVQDALLAPWNDVLLRDGARCDVSRLPLPHATEELVQLLDMPGHASLRNCNEGYRIRMAWNREHFPSALLWLSNGGRQSPPWSGRHFALGFEPVCSAFDLGTQISATDNPISRRGTPTARRFRADEHFVTRYRISVEAATEAR